MLKRGPRRYGMRGFIVKSISALLGLKRLNVGEGCYLTNVQIRNVCRRRTRRGGKGGGGGRPLAVPLSFDIPNKSFVRSSTSFVYLEELSELLSSYARIARVISLSRENVFGLRRPLHPPSCPPLLPSFFLEVY